MSEGTLPHISLARAFAVLFLGLATGGEAEWLALRVRSPLPNPGATNSVAVLIVSPTQWPEPLAIVP